eukprot:2295208-Pyramimonas_sp.AAC.3
MGLGSERASTRAGPTEEKWVRDGGQEEIYIPPTYVANACLLTKLSNPKTSNFNPTTTSPTVAQEAPIRNHRATSQR